MATAAENLNSVIVTILRFTPAYDLRKRYRSMTTNVICTCYVETVLIFETPLERNIQKKISTNQSPLYNSSVGQGTRNLVTFRTSRKPCSQNTEGSIQDVSTGLRTILLNFYRIYILWLRATMDGATVSEVVAS